MPTLPTLRSDTVYVIKLQRADPARPGQLVGRIEHVMSGRRHDFDSGAGLLGCLLHEQSLLTPQPPETQA